jgi:hypothetical protein
MKSIPIRRTSSISFGICSRLTTTSFKKGKTPASERAVADGEITSKTASRSSFGILIPSLVKYGRPGSATILESSVRSSSEGKSPKRIEMTKVIVRSWSKHHATSSKIPNKDEMLRYLPRVAAFAICRLRAIAALPLGMVPFLPPIVVNRGANISSKKGTASVTGLLLKLINALAARGVSGKRQLINSCKRAPQECPIPTTGIEPYCLAMEGATFSKR